MLALIVGGLTAFSIGLYIAGEIMRAHLPKMDLFLASAAVTPLAAPPALAASGLVPDPEAVRFFTAPLVTFFLSGAKVYLTAPDILAILSSKVLLIRFAAWALKPWRKTDERGGTKD